MVHNFAEKNEEFMVEFGKILLKHQRDMARVSATIEGGCDQAALNFARYLRAARANASLSPEELAHQADILAPVIYALERGLIFSKHIKAEHLFSLADVLNEDINIFALLLNCDIPQPGLAGIPVKAQNNWQAAVAYLGSTLGALLVTALMLIALFGSTLLMQHPDTWPFSALPAYQLTAETSQISILSLILVLLLLLLWLAIKNDDLPSWMTAITLKQKRKLVFTPFLLLILISVTHLCYAAGVELVLLSAPVNTGLGQTFEVTVEVQAGTQEVYGASAYLNFDPALLQVVAIRAGDRLPFMIQNSYGDILIYGTNNLRPSAALGGIVQRPVSDTLIITNSQVIGYAYLPGQVRMSAIWNRFGHPGGSVGAGRTLAHELDHHLGLSAEQILIKVDCQGSAMTDAYREDYSEFLTRAGWTGDCEQTMSQYTTGHTDWETISTFYEMLNADGGNMRPSHLPPNLTQVSFIQPDRPVNTLLDPFFNVTNETGQPLALPFGESQAYLFKRQGPSAASNDIVVSLGSPIADLLRVRGAEAGDRLCLFDYSQSQRRIGCIDSITPDSSNLPLWLTPVSQGSNNMTAHDRDAGQDETIWGKNPATWLPYFVSVLAAILFAVISSVVLYDGRIILSLKSGRLGIGSRESTPSG